MNAKQVLIATALVALAPFAQAAQKFGEAYPLDIVETPSTLTRADLREEVQSRPPRPAVRPGLSVRDEGPDDDAPARRRAPRSAQ